MLNLRDHFGTHGTYFGCKSGRSLSLCCTLPSRLQTCCCGVCWVGGREGERVCVWVGLGGFGGWVGLRFGLGWVCVRVWLGGGWVGGCVVKGWRMALANPSAPAPRVLNTVVLGNWRVMIDTKLGGGAHGRHSTVMPRLPCRMLACVRGKGAYDQCS